LLTDAADWVTKQVARTKLCGKNSDDNDVQSHLPRWNWAFFYFWVQILATGPEEKERWTMIANFSTNNHKRFFVLFVALLFVFAGQAAMAQSTIFNIPTTDTVAKGKGYAEFDFLAQMPKPDGGDHSFYYVPRFVAGVGPNLEVGANILVNHVGDFNQAYFQPNLKWRFVNMDDKGVAASVGAILYTPINHRDSGPFTYGLVYGNFSKKVKTGNYGPRFTAGPYGVTIKDAKWSGPRGGAILGYEQPIHPKASIVADWYSGKNGFGYFTPGVSVTVPRNGLVNIGYSIGNDSWADSNATKNRYLFIYYGVTF
jgi:hypothetical protein